LAVTTKKTTENNFDSHAISAVTMKKTTKNKLIFDGQVIATESFLIFTGHDKQPKIGEHNLIYCRN
jgi:hypothetical protein